MRKMLKEEWTFTHRILISGMCDGCCQNVQGKVKIDSIVDLIANNCPHIEGSEARWDSETLLYSDRSSKAVEKIRTKCPRLQTFVLAEGNHFEIVKSNYDLADRNTVVRSTRNRGIAVAYHLQFYKDFILN